MLSKLKSDLKNFILTKNKVASNVVRSILSTITNDGLKDSATEEDIVSIVKKEIKKRKEAIKLYDSNNREDLSKIEQAELLILQSYIPEQMTEEDLKVEMIKIKDELLKENKLNIGELIKATIKKFSSSADNSMISKIAKDLVNL
ncbi:GatB/YqeY domain-containing protein [bacterium]|nr:GatB/YqeY domain-containing protein [bacterium]|tara:strand:+ start:601 stop:1035 length:435 start_codon:yes stop_codon:yes gene_type:complete